MKFPKAKAACLLLLVYLPSCGSLPYQPVDGPVGTVTYSAGLPAVTRNAQLYILAEQSALYPGDRITTDGASRIEVALLTGQTLHIAPNSQWLLISTNFNGNVYQTDSSLGKGALQLSGDSTGHQLTVRTAIAKVETRSGNVWLGYILGNEAGLIVAALDDELVRISNRDGVTTLYAPLQTTAVAAGVAPRRMTNWSEQKLLNTIRRYNQLD